MPAELARARMTVEEFLAWSDAREDDGRYELDDGVVVAMAPERVVHARTAGRVLLTLHAAIERGALPC